MASCCLVDEEGFKGFEQSVRMPEAIGKKKAAYEDRREGTRGPE